MKKLSFLILSIFATVAVMGQGAKTSVSGKIVDASGEPLIGVSVIVPDADSAIGAATDIDGTFTLAVPAGTDKVEISYIGYKTMTLPLQKGKDTRLGDIIMEMDSQMLDDVVVMQSVAVQRKTPVAVSSVDLDFIEEKLGAQEFPEILKSTPGVYATKQGGGFGDSRINMRGLASANVAIMINGLPINDMEWGGTYWSNWQGLSDVTRSMQTQRGLGASKIASPSVGGTINIVTKGLDAKAGGSASYGVDNWGGQSISFNVSSGVTKNGWAFTVLGGRRWGQKIVQGTEYDGWTYFINVSKRLSAKHQLSFTGFGAPQWHNQRNSADGLTIAGYQTVAKKYVGSEMSPYAYNPTYGFDKNGQQRASSHNVYHKPMFSLNHQWQINDNQSLSSVAYASIGMGYGFSGQGRNGYSNTSWYGSTNGVVNTTFRKDDGTFDYGAIQEMNEQSTTGSNMVMSKSVNSHQWYGLLSTYTNHLTDHWELSGGLDVRYYVGNHTNRIVDLYNGDYFMDDSSRSGVVAANNAAAADPNWRYEKLGIGDVVYRDYDAHIMQEGVFAQMEYSSGRLSAFVSGSIANNSYWRVDRFNYDAEHSRSETTNFIGGTAKAGVNYNIDLYNNVFFNTGYISRAPFFSGGVFLNSAKSNGTNPNAKNEKIFSAEVGYGFHNSAIALNANAYYTLWMDKTMARSGNDFINTTTGATDRATINLEGVNARHMGIELDFKAHATKWMDINAMFSWGDWVWNSNVTGYWYNITGVPMADQTGTPATASGVTEWTPEIGQIYGVTEAEFKPHLKSTVNIKGVKVAGSAQTTAALGVNFRPLKGLRIGADWTLFARNYADFSISNPSANGVDNYTTTWRIPWGNEFDLSANYGFDIAKTIRATVYLNVNNVFDNQYIKDAYDGASHDWDTAYRVFYEFGRTITVRLKLAF